MIEFFHVSKSYGGRVALENVSFRIPSGQFVFLTGASGAGKTTLLRLIYRAELPSSGQIIVNGRNVGSLPRNKVPYLRRTIGVVFQEFSLVERRSVFENVTYLPRILGRGRKEQRRLARETLEKVGLEWRLEAFPSELSGGEQQRVAIARALVNRPDVLLADEPTGNLDPDLSREILHHLFEANRAGATVILATHNPHFEKRPGDRVVHLARGRVFRDETAGEEAPEAAEGPGDPQLNIGLPKG